MNKLFMILILLVNLVACSSMGRNNLNKTENVQDILDLAESNASVEGRRVLEVSRTKIANQDIFIGGCWDFINAVYLEAGYSAKLRETIYKSKFKGPYVNSDIIEAGDWLYFVNHSFRDSEHSAIFVAWIDQTKKEALMVNYVGGKKKKPGTYKRFILDKVYNIFRASNM